jgi:peptidoglycan/xylan/chitin deacetylase (PgdA/CDA1 family)
LLALCKTLGFSFAHPDALTSPRFPAKGMVLTFDDAYDDLHAELLPAMRDFGIAPVVFVVADRIGAENDWDQRQGLRARRLATVDQLRDLQRAGAVIGSHSMTHRSLVGLSQRELAMETRDSRHRLEDVFGCAVDWFAYPFGNCDRAARAAVADAGYRAAVTTAPGVNHWKDPFALNRIEIHSDDGVWNALGKLATGKDLGAAASLRWQRMLRKPA